MPCYSNTIIISYPSSFTIFSGRVRSLTTTTRNLLYLILWYINRTFLRIHHSITII
nr:MAG TPA: hypothetical protein [Caudoviricetes sp.]